MLSRIARQVAKRSYATVADASGVKVAGVESGTFPAGTTSLTVVVKGGARYETKPGVAHVLKNFAYKTNSHGSALKIARETELYGGVLSSALGREHLYLTAQCLRGDENHFLEVLASVLGSTQYLAHEYNELVLPVVQTESQSALSNSTTLALDSAHSVAFRRGLGNSLYASAHAPVSVSDVQSYAQQAFAKSNIAVVGTGISTEKLQQAVQSAFGSGSGSSSLSAGASTYYGGEQRIASHGQPTMVIAYGTTNASADLQVLPHLVGGESSIKWSAGSSPLSQAAAKVAGASARSFLLPYSDAALFGVVVSAPTSAGVASVAKDVVAALKGVGSVKDEEVKKAVAKAKFADALSLEQLDSFVAASAQKVFSGSLASAASLEKVSASSIGKATEELFKGKATVVAVGDLAVLPYADELGL